MFVRNLLQAGDYVALVPVGARLTLQYGVSGVLEKVFKGHGDDLTEIPDMVQPLLREQLVPGKILVKGGTTRVYGALFRVDNESVSGRLPECVEDATISRFLKNPAGFAYYAGHMWSSAYAINGMMSIRQQLSTSKFNLLPGYIVSAEISESKFEEMVRKSNYPVEYPRISSYILCRSNVVSYPLTGIRQLVVQQVRRHEDENGNILAKIVVKDSDEVLTVSYADVVTYNIQTNTLLILDSDGRIRYSAKTDNTVREPRATTIDCRFCGRKVQVPKKGYFKCSDPHCVSHQYPQMKRFLSKLNIPSMSYEEYLAFCKRNSNTISVADILDDEWFTGSSVSCTFADVLLAITPEEVVPRDSLMQSFVRACSNSESTIKYYLTHPDKISTDLSIHTPEYQSFIEWLEDPMNYSNICTVVDNPKVQLEAVNKRFDGAPIFRDRTICITGKFQHGDHEEVASILRSYSAEVVKKFNKDVGCVILGDLKEGVNGSVVRAARDAGVPIYEESQFFNMYEIDKDLAENL